MKMTTLLGVAAVLAFMAVPVVSADAAPDGKRGAHAQRSGGGHARGSGGQARRSGSHERSGAAQRGQQQRGHHSRGPQRTRSHDARRGGHDARRGQATHKGRAVHNRAAQQRDRRNVRRQNDAVRSKSVNDRRKATRDRNRHRDARRANRHRPHFSSQHRKRIRSYWRRHHGFHRVARASFPIIVGGFIPAGYAIYDMPSDFYGYVPGYEGYKYIVVGNELLIVDPVTLEIVAVIPV